MLRQGEEIENRVSSVTATDEKLVFFLIFYFQFCH